jgi:hypothetical protein
VQSNVVSSRCTAVDFACESTRAPCTSLRLSHTIVDSASRERVNKVCCTVSRICIRKQQLVVHFFEPPVVQYTPHTLLGRDAGLTGALVGTLGIALVSDLLSAGLGALVRCDLARFHSHEFCH